ncbi:MAG: hypothetical protein RJB01_619 [Actinomycetota bacterium]|jgi:diacylglycerol kinase family enzyme
MRGVLIVNPHATTTSPYVTDVIVQAASHEADLSVTFTTHRGHALSIAREARARELDLVMTLGGDGLVNEVVNGLLLAGDEGRVPILATLPGGSANVFARALGIPAEPVEATGYVMSALRREAIRTIGLGHTVITREGTTHERWFTANAGLGLDARIIDAMDQQRAQGHTATPARYLTTTIKEYLTGADREHPAINLLRPGLPKVDRVLLCLVQNTAPWTYFGPWPIDPMPQASFDTALDVFALRSLGPVVTARAAQRMVLRTGGQPTGRDLLAWHDQMEFTAETDVPIPMQVDGEAIGLVERVAFRGVAGAIRVVADTPRVK